VITIAGVQVANPAEVKVGRFDLTKSSRTASGRMTMEIISTKRRLDVVWKMITDEQFDLILSTIESHKPFFQVSFPGPKGTETMTCYCGDVVSSLWYRIGDIRYWREVSIAFIEQ
jgi:hypothetical protein